MGSLTNLDLHANGLSGTLPASFYNLVNLQYVFLANNQLQGTVGNGIARLTKLASLNLAFNVLSGSFPAVTGLTGLRGLQLQSNRFTGTIPEALGALTGLQQLQLQQNALTGTLPDVWGSFPSLTLLGLFGNLFTGAPPPSLVSSQLSNFADLVNPPVTVCPPGAVASGASVTDGVSGSATWPGVACAPCPPGSIAPAAGASACSLCPVNSYGLGDGVSCAACPAEAFSPAGSPAAANCSCRSGFGATQQPRDAAPASPGFACFACGAGTFSNGSGACAVCPPGSTSPPLSTGVVDCTCGDGSRPQPYGCVSSPPPAPPVLSPAALGGVLGAIAAAAAVAALYVRRVMRRRAAAAALAAGWRACVAQPGEVVVGAPLGRGGFSVVYEAQWKGSRVRALLLRVAFRIAHAPAVASPPQRLR